MEAKEKSKQLIQKFEDTTHPISRITVDGHRCALICVDEIIHVLQQQQRASKYWQEVKKEIKKI